MKNTAPTPDEIPLACHNCGYDVRNLTTPRCPECGTPFKSEESLRNNVRDRKRNLIVAQRIHVAATCLLTAGLIFPYHLSGQAIVDYGWRLPTLSQSGTHWQPETISPPVLQTFFSWVGFAVVAMTCLGMPLLGLACMTVPALTVLERKTMSKREVRKTLVLWAIANLPYLYLLANGARVVGWMLGLNM